MARASKVGCNDNDLRRRGSAVRDAQGYANRHRACSNRNALPVSLTRLSRQSAAQSSCRTIKVRSAASCQSRSIIMRLRSSRRPAICSRRALTTASLESLFARQSAPALGRLSHQTAPTPIPSHGRREGAPLAPHAACWAVRMSMAAAHATLAAGLGGRRQV